MRVRMISEESKTLSRNRWQPKRRRIVKWRFEEQMDGVGCYYSFFLVCLFVVLLESEARNRDETDEADEAGSRG